MIAAIFPGGEPKQNQMCMMIYGLRDQGVHQRKIKLSRQWFYLFPVHGYFEGIGMHRFVCIPELWKHCRPATGIVCLYSKNKIRYFIYDQCMTATCRKKPG